MEEIGSYRIIRKIAEGGMAEIFLARQRGIEGLERTVVLKRIQEAYATNDEFVTMFLDEARLMAVLSHPNLAQVVELGRDAKEGYYLVVEYVRGPTVRELLAAGERRGMHGLPMKEALGIGISIGEALSYVHGRRDEHGRPLRIVHRDLNPSNVVVSYDGAVKVIDFGIAKAATKVHETRTGVVKGTYGYIAPEQLTGMAPTDNRADIFALGVMLYEMLLGTHPFDTGQDLDIVSRVLSAKYLRPRQVMAGFPAAVERAITKCLAPHPEGRPDDVRLVIDALAEHLATIRQVPTMGAIATLASDLVPDPESKAPLGPVPISRISRLPSEDASGPTQRRAPIAGTLVKNLPSLADGPPDEATVTYAQSGGPPTDIMTLAPGMSISQPDFTPTRMFISTAGVPELHPSEAGPTNQFPASTASQRADESLPSATRPFSTAPLSPAAAAAAAAADASPAGLPQAETYREPGSAVPRSTDSSVLAPSSAPRRYAALLAVGFALLLVSGVGLGAFIATGWIAGDVRANPTVAAAPPTKRPIAPTPVRPSDVGRTPTVPVATTPDPVPIEIAPPTTIEVLSEPSGASIALDGQALGIVTPALVTLPQGAAVTWVRVALDGFVTQEIQVRADAEVARFALTPLEDAGVGVAGEDDPTRPNRRIRRRRHR